MIECTGGFRLLAIVSGRRVRLLSRSGKDWSELFPSLKRAIAKLRLRDGVLDGEVVAIRPAGTTKIVYVVSDLPCYAGEDLRDVPALERKDILAGILCGGETRSAARFIA